MAVPALAAAPAAAPATMQISRSYDSTAGTDAGVRIASHYYSRTARPPAGYKVENASYFALAKAPGRDLRSLTRCADDARSHLIHSYSSVQDPQACPASSQHGTWTQEVLGWYSTKKTAAFSRKLHGLTLVKEGTEDSFGIPQYVVADNILTVNKREYARLIAGGYECTYGTSPSDCSIGFVE